MEQSLQTKSEAVAVQTTTKKEAKPSSKNGDYFRHGDLLFLMIDSVPKDFKKYKTEPKKHPRGVTIVEGDVTAHHHTINEVAEYYNYDWGKGRISFVVLDREGILDHEEHGIIVLPKGTYQINYQREIQSSSLNRRNLASNDASALLDATMRVRD